jgi:hypothetical protein
VRAVQGRDAGDRTYLSRENLGEKGGGEAWCADGLGQLCDVAL